jgi:hypothetical protein
MCVNTSDCAGNISQTDRTTKLKKREREREKIHPPKILVQFGDCLNPYNVTFLANPAVDLWSDPLKLIIWNQKLFPLISFILYSSFLVKLLT